MDNKYPAGADDLYDIQRDSPNAGSAVLYNQISYEELEECVFIVRDSISEFYLAPQGEISIAAVEAALKSQAGDESVLYGYGSPAPQTQADADAPIFGFDADAGIFQYGGYAAGSMSANDVTMPIFGDNAPAPAFFDNGAARGNIAGHIAGGLENGESGTVSDGYAAGGAVDIQITPEQSDRETGLSKPVIPGIEGDRQTPQTGKRKILQSHSIPIHQIYRENIKKRVKKRRISILKYLAASFCGTVLGGALVILFITRALPIFGFTPYAPDEGGVNEIARSFDNVKSDTPIEAIYDKVSPSVVGIRVKSVYGGIIIGRQRDECDGSGIIIHPDGYILTSNQVISAAVPSYIPTPRGGPPAEAGLEVIIQRDPGVVYDAELIARDVKTDIAVIKIDASNLPVAELGDSDILKPGEMVLAIGRPGGTDDSCSITDGIISGFNLNMNAGAERTINRIRTNAAINPGNIGGALVNAKGQVIGINIAATDAAGYEGLSFAVPINAARYVADNLIDFSYVKGRAKTGIGYLESYNIDFDYYQKQSPDIPRGVYVNYVEPLSGAFIAGIKVGDIITKMRGEDISDYIDMLDLKDTLAPGDIIEVEVFRAGEYLSLDLEVSEETGSEPAVD